MAKHDHVANAMQHMDDSIKQAEESKLSIEDMPLNTIRDYRLYNEEARKINKKLRVLKYPIKQCPVELHPKQRIIFGRNDQPANPLPVFLSNHLIHFEQTLIPGKQYDLPECIVHYLAEKGTPIYKVVEDKAGKKETVLSHMEPRFSIRTVYKEQ